MESHEASAPAARPQALPARLGGERLAWLAILFLVGALLLVRWSAAAGQDLPVANPLGLALFATIYVLIRMRESGGRL